MIYKVLSADLTATSTGKSMKKLSLESTNGVQNVNIFADFPHYAEINVGSSIDGEIRKNQKGYDNLYSNEIKTPTGAGSAFKQAQMEKTIDYKDNKIGKRMDDKEFNIMISSTMRDAVSLAIAEIKDITTLNTLEGDILKWRTWLLAHWEVDKKDIPPFN